MKYLKNIKDFMNEGYNISQADYDYFEDEIKANLSGENMEELVHDLKKYKKEYIPQLLCVAKTHWSIGGGDYKDFPKEEYTQVIKEVIDKIIREYEEKETN